jgi:hypothetical protein
MMAQDMFEENKVLQAENDSLKSLIEKYLPVMTEQILIMCNIQDMRDDFEAVVYGSNDDGEECCEECLMFIDDCECEEVSDG